MILLVIAVGCEKELRPEESFRRAATNARATPLTTLLNPGSWVWEEA